jgi:hypothetical protein
LNGIHQFLTYADGVNLLGANKNTINKNTNKQTKQTPWPLVRERTIPSERLPHVDEIWCQILWIEGCHVISAADPLGR